MNPNQIDASPTAVTDTVPSPLSLDVLVIALFAVSLSVTGSLLTGMGMNIGFIGVLLLELGLSLFLGYMLGILFMRILQLAAHQAVKAALILLSGYGVYALSHAVRDLSHANLPFEILMEPLLICMIGMEGRWSYPRFSFGSVEISGGIQLIPAMVGAFGFAEIIAVMRHPVMETVSSKIDRVWPRRTDITKHWKTIIRSGIVAQEVRTIPLDGLLAAEGVERIDFLSMDIEFHEPRALAGFDIERYRPALVCVEAHPQVRQQILDYFARHGYVAVAKYLRADPQNLWFAPLPD